MNCSEISMFIYFYKSINAIFTKEVIYKVHFPHGSIFIGELFKTGDGLVKTVPLECYILW